MRHTHDAWTKENDPSPSLMMFDFVAFFMQAAALFAMAAFITQVVEFIVAFLILLGIDIIWLAVRRRWTRDTTTRMSWLYINVLAMLLLLLALLAQLDQFLPLDTAYLITLIAIGRTILDYGKNKTFYFGDDF